MAKPSFWHFLECCLTLSENFEMLHVPFSRKGHRNIMKCIFSRFECELTWVVALFVHVCSSSTLCVLFGWSQILFLATWFCILLFVIRSHKRGLTSLGSMEATGKEVRDSHNVLLPYFNWPEHFCFVRYTLDSNIQLNCLLHIFLQYQYVKSDKIDQGLRLSVRVTC